MIFAALLSWGAGAVAADAVQLDFDFPSGTAGRVARPAEDHFVFTPKTAAPGGQFFYVCVRLSHLPAGRSLLLDLAWPAARKRDSRGSAPKGDAVRNYYPSFAAVLPKIVLQSADLRAWTPVGGATLVDENTARVPVVGTGRPIYIATQIPYHVGLYNDLIDHVRQREPGAVREIGRSHDSLPIRVICLDATNPASRNRTVYIQAYQHVNEFSGPLVADAVVRYLLDTDSGRQARRALSFQILPVFWIDALTLDSKRTKRPGQTPNPNRDWIAKTWPEVRAVDAFIRRDMDAGREYVLGFDLHNGWSNPENSDACYTVFPKSWADPSVIARQKRFIDFMYARTDHEKPGRYWAHDASGTFNKYFFDTTGGLAFTVEFSRFKWWNHEAKAYEPYRPDHPARFAGQFVDAVAAAIEAGLAAADEAGAPARDCKQARFRHRPSCRLTEGN